MNPQGHQKRKFHNRNVLSSPSGATWTLPEPGVADNSQLGRKLGRLCKCGLPHRGAPWWSRLSSLQQKATCLRVQPADLAEHQRWSWVCEGRISSPHKHTKDGGCCCDFWHGLKALEHRALRTFTEFGAVAFLWDGHSHSCYSHSFICQFTQQVFLFFFFLKLPWWLRW